MKTMFRYLSIGLIFVLTGMSLVSAQVGSPNIIDQTVVTLGDLLVTVNATGEVEPLRTVPLTFGMVGTVSEILVDEGDTVQAGDILARIDARDLELGVQNAQISLQQQQVRFDQLTSPARDVDVAVAEAALQAAQANANAAYSTAPNSNDVEIARFQTELARNQLWQAQIQRDQTLGLNPEFRFSETNDPESQEALLNSGLRSASLGISIADTNLTGTINDGPDMSRLSQANASIVQASIQLDNLVNGPDANDIRLSEIALKNSALAVERAQLQLEEMVLIAPFDGIITTNNLVLGELPPGNQPALELANTDAFIVNLLIDETDIVKLEIDQPVNFTLDALPDAGITGTISHIALTPALASAVTAYETQVRLNPTEESIRLGMSSTASVVISQVENAVVVPNRFIRLDRATQQPTVTVLDENNRTRQVVVTLGARNDTQSQILSGLEAGQQVVLVDDVVLPGALGG